MQIGKWLGTKISLSCNIFHDGAKSPLLACPLNDMISGNIVSDTIIDNIRWGFIIDVDFIWILGKTVSGDTAFGLQFQIGSDISIHFTGCYEHSHVSLIPQSVYACTHANEMYQHMFTTTTRSHWAANLKLTVGWHHLGGQFHWGYLLMHRKHIIGLS